MPVDDNRPKWWAANGYRSAVYEPFEFLDTTPVVVPNDCCRSPDWFAKTGSGKSDELIKRSQPIAPIRHIAARDLAQVARAQGLPAGMAAAAWEVERGFEKKTRQAESDGQLSAAEKSEAFDVLEAVSVRRSHPVETPGEALSATTWSVPITQCRSSYLGDGIAEDDLGRYSPLR
jgi:hypothetical protein